MSSHIYASNVYTDRTPSVLEILTSQIQDSNADEDLLCPICSNLIWEPVGCVTCKNHICLKCIHEWRANPNNIACPISKDCSEFIEEKPHPFFLKHLSSLKLSCPNQAKGCEQSIKYDLYQRHVSECQFADVACPNEACGQQVLSKDLAQHLLESCQFQKIECEYCQDSIVKNDQLNHESNFCEKFPFSCENANCEEVLCRSNFLEHAQVCPFQLWKCEYCSSNYGRNEANEHGENCVEKMLICPGCEKQFRQYEYNDHSGSCQEIKVKCSRCLAEYPQFQFNENHNQNDCLDKVFSALQLANDEVRQITQKLTDQQSQFEQRMVLLQSQMLSIFQHSTEIEDLEKEIEKEYEEIGVVLKKENFFVHQLKKHEFQPENMREAVRHFQYLENTSILYCGWHKFHCSDCMACVKQIAPKIKNSLLRIEKAKSEIEVKKVIQAKFNSL